ncbi:CHAD domain-containing protein [Nioella nitratireducens]|uniref:CHAD domain-containing protein n=1 Tax=Nioella nitratireducens TaxID=1287720 RepID=UPI0008FCEEE1|nr:CHAD domain-containing protein [Nioella nitratireducens]
MTRHDDACFLLPVEAVDQLSASPVGRLTPVLTQAEETAGFTLYDTFNQSLRKERRVLIEIDDRLELWQADGTTLSQPGGTGCSFVADLADGPVKHALSSLPELRSLMAIGTGQLRLSELALVDDEEKTQARASLRLLSADGASSVAVVAVQGLRGYDKALAKLTGRVAACTGVPLSDDDLYGRLFPNLAPYAAKPDIGVGHDEAAFDAASDIIAAYLPVARQNEAGVIEDIDTEFLHDYRIALRKIRSVLSLFKGVYAKAQTQDLKARFSGLMAPTGRLRDLDVYLLERNAFYGLLPDSLHGGLDRMFAMFAEERQEALKTLSRHLRSNAYDKDMDRLGKLFDSRKKLQRGPNADLPAYDFACKLIWKRYRKICKIAAGIDADTADEEVHQLRIHCKKLRYLMEFFGPVFPKSAFKSLIKPLKRLQDNLGLFNDYSVQQESLQAFLAGLDRADHDGNLELAQSVGALIAVLHQRQLEERGKVVESFARFNSAETQQTFRDLFHGGKE